MPLWLNLKGSKKMVCTMSDLLDTGRFCLGLSILEEIKVFCKSIIQSVSLHNFSEGTVTSSGIKESKCKVKSFIL